MMLKRIPAFIDAELLWVLASMGHGDELAIVDRNFPARKVAGTTTTGKLIVMPGISITEALLGVLELFPLDDFVDVPLKHMASPDLAKRLDVHSEAMEIATRAEGRKITSEPIERMAFYEAAMTCFAVLQTSETRPYANFILKKGVIR